MPITKVEEGVYVAPYSEALGTVMNPFSPFRTIIDVLEMPAISDMLKMYVEGMGVKIIKEPIMREPGKVPISNLEKVFNLIESNKPCVVVCAMGQERSPLAIVYWISKKKGISITDAYKELYAIRPEIQYRESWLVND